MRDYRSAQLLGAEIGVGSGTPFAMLCRDKIRGFSGLTCDKKLEAPGCIYLKN
jgi:hypothetical protein